MKMKYMSKYLYSFVLVFSFFVSFTQEKKTDSIATKPESYGLRIGTDVSKLIKSITDKDYKGFEFSGDFKISKKRFLAAEIGFENKTTNDTQLNFTTKGGFLKLGFDYNGYENWLDMKNMIHIGMRYGVSTFNQQLNNYKIYNTTSYFPNSNFNENPTDYSGLTAQWIEVVTGVKAEVLTNIYVGFNFRFNYLISNQKPDNFDNLFIPGYNRTYDGKFGVGFNYNVYYYIPIFKSKTKKP